MNELSAVPRPQSASPELTRDEVEFLKVYRRAKNLGFADISISVHEGVVTKLWLTEKLK